MSTIAESRRPPLTPLSANAMKNQRSTPGVTSTPLQLKSPASLLAKCQSQQRKIRALEAQLQRGQLPPVEQGGAAEEKGGEELVFETPRHARGAGATWPAAKTSAGRTSAEAVEAPKEEAKADEKNEEDEDEDPDSLCPICTYPFEAEDAADRRYVVTTYCGHRFHLECLQESRAFGVDGCPMCRQDLPHGITPAKKRGTGWKRITSAAEGNRLLSGDYDEQRSGHQGDSGESRLSGSFASEPRHRRQGRSDGYSRPPRGTAQPTSRPAAQGGAPGQLTNPTALLDAPHPFADSGASSRSRPSGRQQRPTYPGSDETVEQILARNRVPMQQPRRQTQPAIPARSPEAQRVTEQLEGLGEDGQGRRRSAACTIS
uniref:RING-type domain-containing protein n=1 Tax=Phaeomonas parva TaxID=124430 RepID=A0A7S1TSK7_9STRA|mmetsp:Transcript_12689/g.38053  ORF Transcript_12689/g.38053 Transcript_12689/m.38053 type:complete len:373 (+) Transcript_12689:379-1497(+)